MLLSRFRRSVSLVLTAAIVCVTLASGPAFAGTTGTISGTVTDATSGAPVANATVAAASPSGSRTTTTDSKGFYVLQALSPDTYTVSVQAVGYEATSQPGISVFQDQTTPINVSVSKTLTTIAKVKSRSASNLVRPDTTADTYTISSEQLNAVSLGNNTHKTLYQYVATIPGVTGNTYGSQPRIQGGSAADISYEYDGIPINEQITGLFTTNLSNVGIGSLVVNTGGLNASQAGSGLGIINSVVKSGTYPGFANVAYAATPTYRNVYETLEYGGATQNKKLSWYFSLDNTNALNEYNNNQTYPLVLIEQANGPGVIKTLDLQANFHFKPTNNDDFQFLIQNGVGEFGFGYLMARAPGEPVPLTALPCAGATVVATPSGGPTYTGGAGGVAPNGQPCPVGLYFGTASTQHDGGNIWHHYSGIGKIQWTHILNDRSSFMVRLSENFNQYIFDQPIVDSNLPGFQNNGAVNVNAACPPYPYTPGTPVAGYPSGPGKTGACFQLSNWLSTGYYQDRRSNIYQLDLKYNNDLNANARIELGAGYTYAKNLREEYYTGFFNTPGTWSSQWPALVDASDFPTKTPYAYAQGDFKAGKFLLSPGLRWESRKYDYAFMGGRTASIVVPTFAFNYAADRRDVILGSLTSSASLPASYVAYRYVPPGPLNGPTESYYCSEYNPTSCTVALEPTRIHRYSLMWERQLDANTSMKIGWFANSSSNILMNYTPYTLDTTKTPPVWVKVPGTTGFTCQCGVRKGDGIEFGLNHLDNRKSGVSWWLASTFSNFFTNTTSSLTTPYGSVSLPPSLNGQLFRSSDPPLIASFTADVHQDDFHFYPQLYYQSPVRWYTGSYSSTTGVVTRVQQPAIPWMQINATVAWDFGPKKDWNAGVQGMNILNNSRGTTPCFASSLSSADLGLGCGAIRPIGIGTNAPGANAGGYQYLNVSQSTPLFFFFIQKKI
jgi:hypothetical protein